MNYVVIGLSALYSPACFDLANQGVCYSRCKPWLDCALIWQDIHADGFRRCELPSCNV